MHHWIALHGPRPAPPRQQWRAGAASAQASSGQFSSYLSALVTFRSLDSTYISYESSNQGLFPLSKMVVIRLVLDDCRAGIENSRHQSLQ